VDQNITPLRRILAIAGPFLAVLALLGVADCAGALLMVAPMMQ
jgi:hypothetical protein